MTDHLVCWGLRDSLECGASSAKLAMSQENYDKLVTLLVLVSRLLLLVTGLNQFQEDFLGDDVGHPLELSH